MSRLIPAFRKFLLKLYQAQTKNKCLVLAHCFFGSSNRLGMSALIRRAERVVKTHRDVADEKAAGIGHFKTAGLEFHEAVGGKRRERGEFLFKMLLEVDAELSRSSRRSRARGRTSSA